ncbi:LysM peptidoglycan-binding domain-containing protein [Pseudomonas wadenswilerensis]
MVAVVAGNGLGLFNTSLNILGAAAGSLGQGSLGQSGGKAWVNASTGNLILRFTDEQLSGQGQDLFHTRTYNTLGALDDADADGWRWEGERRVVLSGTALATGSRITRTTGDGHETVYNWNGSRYQSTEGDGAHDFIQWNAQTGEWYWTDGSTRTVEHYDGSSGMLASVRDASGTLITYGYQNGRLSSVSDSSGQALLMVYNAAGKLARVDTRTVAGGPLTQQVYYEYDGYGRLIQVTTDLTPDDNSVADYNVYRTLYTYDGSSFRIASISQSDGSTVSFTYVQVGSEYRVATVTDAFGTSTFSYDLANRRTGVRNLLGEEWGYFYDGQGQLTHVQSPNINGDIYYTGYQYDADGNVTRVTDTYGNTISYEYDERGNRVRERDAKGATVARVYNAANQMLSEIRYSVPATRDAASGAWTEPPASSAQVTRYVYDHAERLRFVVSATGSVIEYAYGANGLRAQEIAYGANLYPLEGLVDTGVLGESSLMAWGAAQDHAKTRLTGFNYDYRGNLILRVAYANVDASGNWLLDSAAELTRYVYNAQGQLLQTLAGRGLDRSTQVLLSSTTYDGMGRVLGQMDANGTRTTVYNGSQRSIVVTSASGLTVTQLYDARGHLIAIQETAAGAVSRSTGYFYDAAGRLNMKQDPTGVRSFTFYDPLGRVGAEVDGAGNVTRYTYNANDQRIAELRYATPADTSAWFNGSMVSVTLAQILPASNAADRLTRFDYDQAGRLVGSSDAAGTLTTYSYDGRGQLVRQQVGERIIRTFYDADGRQVGKLDAEGYLRENVYNAAGQLQQTIRYAAATNPTLRGSGSLAELRPTSGGGSSAWSFYDLAGRQIGSVDEKGFVSETVYNEGGNARQSVRYLTAYTGVLQASTGFAAIRAAVATAGGETVETFYDEPGRISRRVAADGTVTTFEYDAAGRLVRETAAAGTAEERSLRTRYDAFGQTIGKLLGEASGKITVGMSEAQVAAVYSQYGMTWSYDAAGRVASVTDALGNRTLSYYDNTGRLTRVINAVGEVSETRYNAFGDAVERTQLSNRLAAGTVAGLAGGLQTAALDTLVAAIRNASLDSRTTQAYDTRGLLLTSIDAEGISTTNQYDQYGQLQRQIRVIAGDRKVTTAFGYNLRGERISQTRDAGGLNLTDSTAYDAFGRVVRTTDAAGFITTTDYQDSGRTVVVRDPLNQSRRSEFDAFGRTLREVDALGHITQYSYDGVNRSVTVTMADGTRVSTWKTRHGETLKTVDGKGAVTQYEYNREGQLTRTTDALGQVAEVKRYDQAGRLSESVDARGIVTHLDYDAVNRVVQRSVDPTGLNQRTTYVFDTAGRQVKVVEFAGTTSARTTDYTYDRKGQLTQTVVDPSGLQLSTRYSYDGTGNVLRISQGTVASPEQRVTDYVYNAAGQRRFTVDALGYVSERRYDAADNVIEEVRYANKLQGSRDAVALQKLGVNVLRNTSFNSPGSDGLPAGWSLFNVGPAGNAQVNPGSLATLRPQDAGGDNMVWVYQAQPGTDATAYVEFLQTVGQVQAGQRYSFSAYTGVQGASAWAIITWLDASGHTLGWTSMDAASLNTQEARGGQSLSDYKRIVAEGVAPPGAVSAQVTIRSTQAGLGESRLLVVRPDFQAVPVTASADDRVTSYVYDALGRQRYSVDALGYVSERKYDAAGNVTEEVRYANKLQGSRDAVTLQKLGVNVLSNTSFSSPGSDGLPAGWSLFNVGPAGNAQVNPGSLATLRPQDAGGDNMVWVYQAQPGTDATAYVEFLQTVGQVQAGQRYSFSAYTGVQGASAWAIITWLDASGHTLNWTSMDAASLNTQEARGGQSLSDYKRIVAEGVAPPGAVSAQVTLRSTQAGQGESRLLVVRPDFHAVPVTASTDDRVTSYIYDALGRQRYSVDALGYVSERKYDAAGNVTEEVRYANKLQGSRDAVTLQKLGVNVLSNTSFSSPGSDGLPAGWSLFNVGPAGNAQVNPGSLATLRPQDAGGDNMVWVYQAQPGTDATAYVEFLQTVGQVQAGQRYSFSAYTGVQGASAWAIITWLDASGHTLGWTSKNAASLNQQEAQGGQSLGDYKRIVAEGVAPPGAVSAQVTLRSTQAGQGESRLLVVRPDFHAVPVTASTDDRVTSYVYDALGRQRYSVDALGYVSERKYDAAGNVIEEVRYANKPQGMRGAMSLQTLGSNLTASAADRVTSHVYDALGRQRYSVDALGYVSERKYDAAGNVIEEVRYASKLQGTRDAMTLQRLGSNVAPSADDRLTSYVYDTLGRQRYSVDALGYVSERKYDAAGNVIEEVRYANKLQGSRDAVTLQKLGVNVLSNTSFGSPGSDGVPAGWSLFNVGPAGSAQVNPGSLAALRPQDAGGDNMVWVYQADPGSDAAAYVEIRQTVGQIQAGQRYSFSAYTGVQGTNAWAVITWLDASGHTLSWTGMDVASLNTQEARGGQSLSDYKRIVAEGVAPPGAVSALVAVRNTPAGQDVSRLLVVRPDFQAVPVTASADDRVTSYVYDTLGRQRYSVDALGYVSERKYDAAGNVTEEVRYANKLQGSRDAVTLQKLGVNVLSNTSFSSPGSDGLPAGWSLFNVGPAGSAQVNPGSLEGLRPQDAGGDNMVWVYQAQPGTDATAYVEFLQTVGQVQAGQRYSFSAYTGVQGASAWAIITWLDASGHTLNWTSMDAASLNTQEARGGQSLSDYKRIVAEGVAPPGAVSAQVTIRSTQAGLGESRLLVVRPDFQAVPVTSSADDRLTRYAYDTVGRLTRVIDPLGYTESYTYDAAGNRTSLTNKNGQTWTYRYDQGSRLLEEITPPVSVSKVDSAGQGTSDLLVSRNEYDAFGSVVSRTEGRLRLSLSADPQQDDLSQARTRVFGYDALGRQVRITSPGWYDKVSGQYQQNGGAGSFQVTTEVTYDGLGNAVRNRVRINNTGVAANDFVDSYKAYDVLGQVRYEVDALKGVTAYEYDGFGQTVLTRRNALPLNAVAPASGYYQVSDFNAATLPASPGNDRSIITRYDRLGRKTEVQQDMVSLYAFTGNVASSFAKTVAPVKAYTYNAFGQVTRETLLGRDINGASVMEQISTVNYYDRVGQRVGTVDALGYYTRLEYSGSGKVSRQVEYATALAGWNEGTLPAPVAGGKDRSVRFVYDAADRLVQTVRENATWWQQSFATNPAKATVTQVTGDALVSRSTYDGVGNALTVTDGLGNVTTTEYNAFGQVVKVTEPARYTARVNAANPFDNAVYASPTTVYGLNAFGQVVSERREAGAGQAGLLQVTRSLYDAAGHLIKEFDAAGSAQEFKVDVAGRRLEESRQIYAEMKDWQIVSQIIRRTYSYDSLGQQLSTSDWYNDAGVQKSTTNSVVYNHFGEITVELLNGNYKARYTYNQLGNAIEQTNAQGVTSFSYDLTGKVSRSAQLGDLNSATDDRITYVRNDLLGRVLEQHLPAFDANLAADTFNNVGTILTTPIIRQTSDRWGNVLSRIDPRGYVTTYTYDHNNQVLSETLPVTDILLENGTSYRASLIHEKRYDALGQLIEEADRVSTSSELLRTRQHVYNQAGELVRDIDALGASREYAMDAHGNRVGTRDELKSVTFDSYDAMDRHVSHGIVRNGQQVTQLTNQYDQAGRLYAEIDGAVSVTETLVSTQVGYLSNITGTAGNTRFSLFDERGNIVKTRTESGIQKTFLFSDANRKVKETDGLGKSLTWTYNEGDYGRLTAHSDLGDRNYSYVYNAFGQLAAENADKAYVYYANGLLKSVSVTTGAQRDFLVGKKQYFNEQWQAIRTSTYSYDLVGNRVRDVLTTAITWSSYVGESDAGAITTNQENRFRFDEVGRLAEAHSLAGRLAYGTGSFEFETRYTSNHDHDYVNTFKYSGGDAARIDLTYQFDEFGNRRRVKMDSATVLEENWFKYDLNDRAVVVDGFLDKGAVVAGLQAGQNLGKGYTLSYDAAGRRIASERWLSNASGQSLYERSEYAYNDLNQVQRRDLKNVYRQSGANSGAAAQSVSAAQLDLVNTYDERGRVLTQTTYKNGVAQSIARSEYRGDNQKISERTYGIANGVEYLSQANYFAEAGMIDAAGNQTRYRYAIFHASGNLHQAGDYLTTYVGFETYKSENLKATAIGQDSGITNYSYNDRGDLLHVSNHNGKFRRYAVDGDGRMISAQVVATDNTQLYLNYQNGALANAGAISRGAITDTLVPISADYPAHAPSSYVVNQGDTLESIAQMVWGDRSMWYVIADANGLSDTLMVGSSLRIPNVVTSNRNDATTFKPYNPAEVIGDTITPPVPPKPKKKKCNAAASIVMVVVAVVATIFTAGAAAYLIAPATTAATVGGAVGAGMAAVSAAGVGVGISAGTLAVGAVAGSLASQAVGKAMGVVDKISWKQAAVAGLGSYIGAGIMDLAAGASSTLSNAMSASSPTWGQVAVSYGAQGVAGYTGSYIASKAVGLDTSFSWKNMAASAIGSIVAGSINQKSGFWNSTIRGQVSAHSSAWMRDKWFGGGRPDYGQVAADAFGNSLVDYMVRSSRDGQQRERMEKLTSEVSATYERLDPIIKSELADKDYWLASSGGAASQYLELDATYVGAQPEFGVDGVSVSAGSRAVLRGALAFKNADFLLGAPVAQGLRFDLRTYGGFGTSNAHLDVPEVPEIDSVTGRFVSLPVQNKTFSERAREFYDEHAVVPLIGFKGDLAHDAAALVANTHIVRVNSLPLLLGAADEALIWAGLGGIDRLSPIASAPSVALKSELMLVNKIAHASSDGWGVLSSMPVFLKAQAKYDSVLERVAEYTSNLSANPFFIAIDPVSRKGPMGIDTSLFAAGDRTMGEGVRNSREFWRTWASKYPETLSESNQLGVLKKRASPVVDDAWIQSFPEHKDFMGEILVHHHLDYGSIAIPLPGPLHAKQPGWGFWHVYHAGKWND